MRSKVNWLIEQQTKEYVRRERIRNRLKLYRRDRGLSQKEVAQILGVESSSMISRWEKGLSLPGTLNVIRIAALYRTSVDALYWELRLDAADEIRKREHMLSLDTST